MPGPAPKHPSVRARTNDPKKGFTSLPAGGRLGAIPPWPLRPNPIMAAQLETARDRVASLQVEVEVEEDGRKKGRMRRELNKNEMAVATLSLQIEQATDDEVALWDILWRTPQATVWEDSHSSREVAQYVRWKVLAEQGDLKAAVEARQLSDRLGLNPLALTRLHLEIERADEAETRGEQRRQRATPARADKPKGDPRGTLRAV